MICLILKTRHEQYIPTGTNNSRKIERYKKYNNLYELTRTLCAIINKNLYEK